MWFVELVIGLVEFARRNSFPVPFGLWSRYDRWALSDASVLLAFRPVAGLARGEIAMRFAVVVVAFFGLTGGNGLIAAEPAAKNDFAVRVGDSSQGDVAYGAAETGPWKVARQGESLPSEVFLRTSAFGPSRVELTGGFLILGPESKVHVAAAQKKVVVTSGRAFLQSLPDWSVHASALTGRLAAETSAEFELGAGRFVTGRILAGKVSMTGDGREPVSVEAGHAFAADPETRNLSLADLPPADIERLHAAAEPIRQPQGLGQLVVNDPQTGSSVRLNLARYHVNVVLHPPVALVQIDQSFYNPYLRQQEGTFVFNLPDGASVSRFAMYTSSPTDLIEGELIERAKAANIYQSIVNRQRDPAILEEIGSNLFRMRVFPIFPNDTKRILLDYTVPIVEQEEGRYSFELPLMSDLEPVWDFSIGGTIRGPNVAGTVRSPSHPTAKIDAADAQAVKFLFKEHAYRPETAFRLDFQQRPTREATIRSFVVTGPPPVAEAKDRANEDEVAPLARPTECEFLATISPAALGADPKVSQGAASPADVLILADSSGGLGDRTRLRQAVRTIAKSLRAQDRFQLGCVDVGFRPLAKGWVTPQTAAADEALTTFDREFFLGETDFEAGLRGAVGSLAKQIDAGRRRLIVYVGDGGLRADQTLSGESQKRCIAALTETGARFCAVLVDGDTSGSGAMENLTAATGGRRTVSNDEGGFVRRALRLGSLGLPHATKDHCCKS